jgi:hypothetical protein
LKFIYGVAHRRDGSGIFVADNKGSIGRLCFPGFVDESHIAAAYGGGFDFDQNVLWSRPGGGHLFHFQLIFTHQHNGLHFIWNCHGLLLLSPGLKFFMSLRHFCIFHVN